MPRPLRLLLLGSRDPDGIQVGELLREAGAELCAVGDLDAAVAALARDPFDAVVLCDAAVDADPGGCCAALAGVADAPPLVLLDRIGQGRHAGRPLPAALQAVRVLPWPGEAAKLTEELEGLVERGGAEGATPEVRYPELLAAVAVQRVTGVLEVRADGVTTRLHVQEGVVRLAEGGSLRETLGRFLLRRGALAEADYARVIERMTDAVFDSEPLRMGEVLVELGLMTPDEVFRALSEQVVEKVLAGFAAKRLTYHLGPAEAQNASANHFDVPCVEALLLRGLAERARPEEAERILGPYASQIPHLALEFETLIQRFRPDAAGRRALHAIDGRRALGVLWRRGEVPPALLAALLLCGALRLAEGPRRSGQAVRPPPVRTTREVVRAPRQGSPKSSPRAATGRPADAPARLEAEHACRRGIELLAHDQLEAALRELGRAVQLQPQEPEYRMQEAFAAYLHHASQLRRVRAKAMACAVRMAEHDPDAARPHAILGRLALDDGQLETARRELEAAVVRDPEESEALRALQRLRSRRR